MQLAGIIFSRRTCDIHQRRIVDELSNDMIDRHVAHQKHEPNPWHQGSVNIFGDEIGAGRTDEHRPYAGPEVEEPDEVEEGDAARHQWKPCNVLGSLTL